MFTILMGEVHSDIDAFNAYRLKKKEVLENTVLSYKGIIPEAQFSHLLELIKTYDISFFD